MLERTQYEKELKEMSSEEEEDLTVFDEYPEATEGGQDEDDGDDVVQAIEEVNLRKAKGKQKADEKDDPMGDDLPARSKRRRPQMDPFAGEFHSDGAFILGGSLVYQDMGTTRTQPLPRRTWCGRASIRHQPTMRRLRDRLRRRLKPRENPRKPDN
jgi:hypothetical protein